MSDTIPSLHHVVFCVHRADQDQTAALWTDLGFVFAEIDLADAGLRVLLDWDRGIEIISPTDETNPEAAAVTQYLRDHGPGIYSVVLRTSDLSGPMKIATRHGAVVEYQQHRSGDGYTVDEAMLTTAEGLSVTFLATDIPG
jgi:4-hydroxyphenylpyruvate dioxygenase-like putative hemolysin